MKIKNFLAITTALIALALTACNDDMSEIGSSLTEGDVQIENDSTFQVTGRSVRTPEFDSRSTTTLIGRLNVPEYGRLECSFVSQMLSASSMLIPDSISVERVDSMKMILRLPRLTVTGDSLAPQQLSVYRLNRQLPKGINSSFDPSEYFEKQDIIGCRNFSMSALGAIDSIYKKEQYIKVKIPMPVEEARRLFQAYRNDPSVFQWPSSLNKVFPGIFVTPTFGSGCVANVTEVNILLYYHKLVNKVYNEDGTAVTRQIHHRDSVSLFGTAPEVLSSTNITFTPSESLIQRIQEGQTIVVAPAGYNVKIDFPLEDIIKKYHADRFNLSVINDLVFEVPAAPVKNDFGIVMSPYLLMVKSSELESFFRNNKLPDGKSSFWAMYSSATGSYTFTTMRQYITDMLAKEVIEPDDYDFTIVPVFITTETYTDPETYKKKTAVTGCTPYLIRPTMTRLFLDNAKVKFTFSIQQLN